MKEVWVVVYWGSSDFPAVGGIIMDSTWSTFDLAAKREKTLIQSKTIGGNEIFVKIMRLDVDDIKK